MDWVRGLGSPQHFQSATCHILQVDPTPLSSLLSKILQKSYKRISVKAKSLIFHIVHLPSLPASVHDHSAQSGCAGNVISSNEKSSGISQGLGQSKVSNKSSNLPQDTCTSTHFSCFWFQKTSKVSAPCVISPCHLCDVLSHFRNASPVFCAISSLSWVLWASRSGRMLSQKTTWSESWSPVDITANVNAAKALLLSVHLFSFSSQIREAVG